MRIGWRIGGVAAVLATGLACEDSDPAWFADCASEVPTAYSQIEAGSGTIFANVGGRSTTYVIRAGEAGYATQVGCDDAVVDAQGVVTGEAAWFYLHFELSPTGGIFFPPSVSLYDTVGGELGTWSTPPGSSEVSLALSSTSEWHHEGSFEGTLFADGLSSAESIEVSGTIDLEPAWVVGTTTE